MMTLAPCSHRVFLQPLDHLILVIDPAELGEACIGKASLSSQVIQYVLGYAQYLEKIFLCDYLLE